MSDYPCTGIDKAALKFGLQDSKISQIVSVIFSIFFLNFARQLLPIFRLKGPSFALLKAVQSQSVCFPTNLTPYFSPSFFFVSAGKKIAHYFFQVIFLFKKLFGHFSFTKRQILLSVLYSFYLTRFY
ncbi:hypothetical protein [Paraburkholderia sp. BL23I1N1]|uniref:hypothetical protein n=1 Tax=Paraburkholderia sp. BL23I1N1 TaxID=1938802 RepID=UPI0011C35879|nr:hypothetical protein [Paraburkholderia sp. BL23I1N1]